MKLRRCLAILLVFFSCVVQPVAASLPLRSSGDGAAALKAVTPEPGYLPDMPLKLGYDPGAGVIWVVVVGDGITMDTYGGNANDPLSLHKYLYGGGNPVNRIDPSGNQSLTEITVVVAVVSVIVASIELRYHPIQNWRKARDLAAARAPTPQEQAFIADAITRLKSRSIGVGEGEDKPVALPQNFPEPVLSLDDVAIKVVPRLSSRYQGLLGAVALPASNKIIIGDDFLNPFSPIQLTSVIFAEYQHVKAGYNEPNEAAAQQVFLQFLQIMGPPWQYHPEVSTWQHGGQIQ